MANLRNVVINDSGFITIPSGSTAQRPASAAAGMIRTNSSTGFAEYYNGSTWVRIDNTVSASATGAAYTIDTVDDGIPYTVHAWYGSGSFTVTSGGEVEYLIVAGAGGGAGGNPNADGNGGGGAGGMLTGTIAVTPQTYTITVGGGGAGGAASPNSPGADGSNSSAFGLIAIGGGGGGSDGSLNGRSGGSGGGASTSGAGGTGGAGTAGQGFPGGLANAPGGGGPGGGGGGGGGAGGPGSNGNQFQPGGRGGLGRPSTITGKLTYYAAGGGGSSWQAAGGFGGTNTGGWGGSRPSVYRGYPGAINSGSGGGAGTAGYASGAGGSGIVIIRYPRTSGILSLPPDIPQEGLVYNLDAGSASSYNWNQARTTWKDANGKSTNFSLAGVPGFSGRYGGAIDFTGDVSGSTSYNANSMDFRYGQTLVGWIEPTGNVGRRNLHNQAYAGSGTLTHEPAGEINYYFGTGGENNSPYVGDTSPFTVLAGEGPVFYAVSRNQRHNIVQWYKNGVLLSTSAAGDYDLTTNSVSNITIGRGYTDTFWIGWMYMQICYNRGLGEQEIIQIYNATRTRFGK
jgi:hypothetical protein